MQMPIIIEMSVACGMPQPIIVKTTLLCSHLSSVVLYYIIFILYKYQTKWQY